MKRALQGLLVIVLLLVPAGRLQAEKVADLPKPTGYVSDFAGVLSPATKQNLEILCTRVDRQAHAQIAVVTIKSLDDDQPIEEFATALEEKWKVGPKGTDRGILMIVSLAPRRFRIEVGYGLEGILNDAKVGDINRAMRPSLAANDYNAGITLGVQRLAQIIGADAGVAIDTGPPQYQPQYHRQQQPEPIALSLGQVLIGGGVLVLIVIFLAATGNIGILFFLLGSLFGGGGGGRRGGGGFGGGNGGGGGGFGGFGGGSSGGGGASSDY